MKRFLSPALVGLLALLPVRAATVLDLPEFRAEDPDVKGGLKAAYVAHQDGRYLEAFATIKKAVLEDDPRAWFFLGWLYETGRGTQRDAAAGIRAYQKSYELGNKTAPFRLCNLLLRGTVEQVEQAREILTKLNETRAGDVGLMLGEAYALGLIGEKPNYDQALKWLQSSAKSGDSRARLNLASLLEGKYGFPEKTDREAAIEQLRQAAEQGNALAMAALGSRYLHGAPGIKNEKNGLEWLYQAAALNVDAADLVLGDYEAKTKKNYLKAREHYAAAIGNGSISALLRLGTLDQLGLGANPNAKKALDLYKRAAARGSTEGAHSCATLLLNAKPQENQAAFVSEGYRFLLAAASQLTEAQVDLAMLYLSGRLGVADPVSAAAWFDRAARLGDARAQNNLGTLYESGTGVPRNWNSAYNLYVLAAKQGHAAATTAIARFTARGMVVERDLAKAWALFSLAAESGDDDGARLLGQLTAQMDAEQLKAGKATLQRMKNPPKEGETETVPDKPAGDAPAKE